jgi:hypothetical protein
MEEEKHRPSGANLWCSPTLALKYSVNVPILQSGNYASYVLIGGYFGPARSSKY